MNKLSFNLPMAVFASAILLGVIACSALLPASPSVTPSVVPPTDTATIFPSPVPPTETAAPLLSQQVTLVGQAAEESNQTPPFTIKSQTPQLQGSDDPRLAAFNQRLHDLVAKEEDVWRQSFLQNTAPVVTNGSFLETSYTLVSQRGDLWSFKFDFHFYSDGAAHPGSYSITLNYDLALGKELALADLFLPDTNYLEAIANYCIAELSKQEFFEGPFAEGAQPTAENYRNWNITPDGLLITFDEYQVAPYAAGPQAVTVPYSALQDLIDPAGPLQSFIQ